MRFKVFFVIYVLMMAFHPVYVQNIAVTNNVYYKLNDSIFSIDDRVNCCHIVDWGVIVKNLRLLNVECENRKCFKVKYIIRVDNRVELFHINYFIADSKYNLLRQLQPHIKSKYFELKFCLENEQILLFCIDGGRVFEFK